MKFYLRPILSLIICITAMSMAKQHLQQVALRMMQRLIIPPPEDRIFTGALEMEQLQLKLALYIFIQHQGHTL